MKYAMSGNGTSSWSSVIYKECTIYKVGNLKALRHRNFIICELIPWSLRK